MVPEGEKRKQGFENLFEEIMTENLLNLVKELDIQVQEVERIPNKMNQGFHIKTHHGYNAKGQKQRKNLKSSKRKAVSYL